MVLGRRHEGTEALDPSRHLFHLAVSELYELYQTDNIKCIAFLQPIIKSVRDLVVLDSAGSCQYRWSGATTAELGPRANGLNTLLLFCFTHK